MRARLGINTCFAVKRWPRPGDWARIVRDELGLEVVELSLAWLVVGRVIPPPLDIDVVPLPLGRAVSN